jgi:hypothetical protein
MFLLYVDESGNPDGQQDRYFVLGGIAMFERIPYFMNQAVNELEAQFFPNNPVEFHAQAIVAHAEEPWKSLPAEKRFAILNDLCEIITRHDVVLFAVALERSTTAEPITRAFEELCTRFDLFLERQHSAGNQQRGLIIFDETRYESRLQTLLGEYRNTGTRHRRLRNFADVPFFADSKSTRLLQLADFVAYSVFRRYERADTRWLDKIISKCDSADGRIHGLVHLTSNYSVCPCPACLTRRITART